MPTVNTSGSQLTVINTEHTLATLTTNKFFTGYVDLTPMLAGDTVEIKVSAIVKTAGSYIQYWLGIYTGVQANPLIYIPPLPSDIGLRVTLRQTAGSVRTFDWKIYEI